VLDSCTYRHHFRPDFIVIDLFSSLQPNTVYRRVGRPQRADGGEVRSRMKSGRTSLVQQQGSRRPHLALTSEQKQPQQPHRLFRYTYPTSQHGAPHGECYVFQSLVGSIKCTNVLRLLFAFISAPSNLLAGVRCIRIHPAVSVASFSCLKQRCLGLSLDR
jgi:hypothetical protein